MTSSGPTTHMERREDGAVITVQAVSYFEVRGSRRPQREWLRVCRSVFDRTLGHDVDITPPGRVAP